MINVKLKEGIKEIVNSVLTYRQGIVYLIHEDKFNPEVMEKIEDKESKIKDKTVNNKKPKTSKKK
jgi:hypothetical protein